MSAKQIAYGQQVPNTISKVVVDIVRAVAATLGPKGKNVIIEAAYGAPKVTKDGATVAKAIELKDKLSNMVAQLFIQVASSTAEEAGDGTTTSTVLAGRFTLDSIKHVVSGVDSMSLFRGMKKAANRIVEELQAMSKPCTDFKSIEQVGTISANGDRVVGTGIAEIMQKVGKNGVVTVQEGNGVNDEQEVAPGMNIDRGYISPHFVTNRQTGTVELENPYVLLVDKKISNIREILGLLEKVAQASRSLFIVAEDVDGEALPTLILNNLRGIVKVCAVKAPGFGDRRKEMLRDIAVLTKAEVISEEIGLSLEKTGLESLGSAKRIIVDKDSFTIIDGSGGKEEIDARIAEINAHMQSATSPYEQEKYQERLAKLAGGVGVLKVGAATEVEMKEKKARVEDALNATRAAVEEGIVPGGGVALLRAAHVLDGLKGENSDEDAGIAIIAQGIRAPLYQIIENTGGEAAVVAHELLNTEKGKNVNYGYNAATGTYGDMIEMGIIDPTKVTRTALQKAVSIAGMLITAECMIAELPKEEDAAAAGGMPGGGMGGMDMM